MIRWFKLPAAGASLALALSPAVLHAEATPAQSPPEPPALEAYGDLPAVEDVALSESGQRVAYIARIAGARHVLALEAGKVLTMASIGDLKTGGLHWIGEDRMLVYRHDTFGLGPEFLASKAEVVSGIILPIKGEEEYVFSKDADVDDVIFGYPAIRKVAGKWKGYFGGLKLEMNSVSRYEYQGSNVSLFEVDLERNHARQIGREPADDQARPCPADCRYPVIR